MLDDARAIVQDRCIAQDAANGYIWRKVGDRALPETPETAPTFASALERLMTSRGLSQAALARGLGVWDANVGRWRRGGGIEIENVRKIAEFFGVDALPLEQLAGYRDRSLPVTGDTSVRIDPQMKALLDAEIAETHEELSGVEPQFWPIILDAGRVARQAAARIARMAAPQSISDASGQSNSAKALKASQLKRGHSSSQGQPQSGGLLLGATV